MTKEKLNKETGEITPAPKFNEVIIRRTVRPNGTLREQQDFSNCPTLAEQHTAHLTDINYLISKYKPDELTAYLEARNMHRREILAHDFASEPTMQEAKNIIYRSKQEFEALDEDVRRNFSNHLEFLKFIDNPANAEKMLKLKILTPRQLEKIQISGPNQQSAEPNQQSSDPNQQLSQKSTPPTKT